MLEKAGAKAARHTIHSEHQHLSWDNSRAPALNVAPGDVVEFKDIDAVCGQLSPQSSAEDVGNLDFARVNPVAGPVYVDGAEPGDALKVTIVDLDPSGWAWTAIVPGFGLLADDFTEPALHIWSYDKTFKEPALFGPGAKVPLKPFCGTIGVAPGEAGSFSTIPPSETGGNMDVRDITLGVALYLPVRVPGALFSIGDPHCAQGDGEVCGTAIESPMSAACKLELLKGENLRFPRFETPGPVSRHLDGKGYEVATGIGPDLMEAARNAVRGTIDGLGKSRKMSPEDAYMLCSVCADLRISEIVDQPNWVVSCYLPRIVFD
ncbi:MAG: acetamidase/formamidase family protein [Alphaproteobacteria bacterium]|nr:acetamidase/formamidase family protein [Pseudomonadota bacterium]